MNLESPCINVCALDAAGRMCTGCFRTIDEIVQWSQMKPGEKLQVLQTLPNRKAVCCAELKRSNSVRANS
ncbi:MAG: DUF1289 domain-containing protein [Planctomycetota bacterium]